MNYGGKIANDLGGVGHLNIENDINEASYENNEMKKMSKTSVGFRLMKKTYEEKMDTFIARNNVKFIEPNKTKGIEKEKEKEKNETSSKGNKSFSQKGSDNNSKKIS